MAVSGWQAGYVYLLPGPHPEIARTVCLSDDLMIDVTADGCPVGIEWLGEGDWTAALAMVAMSGRLRLL